MAKYLILFNVGMIGWIIGASIAVNNYVLLIGMLIALFINYDLFMSLLKRDVMIFHLENEIREHKNI